MNNQTGTLNVKQLADYLGIGLNVSYSLVRRPDFPALRIGKRIVVPLEALNGWLKTNSEKPLV